MNQALKCLVLAESHNVGESILRHLNARLVASEYRFTSSLEQFQETILKQLWDYILVLVGANSSLVRDAAFILRDCDLDIPLIAISDPKDQQFITEVLEYGAHDYIHTNNLERLVPAIERELRQAALRNELKSRLKELINTEQRYKTLIENINLGLFLVDEHFHILMLNTVQKKLMGTEDSDWIGRKCYEVFATRDSPCAVCPGLESLKARKPSETIKVWRKASGEQIYARLQAFPVLDLSDSSNSFIVVVEDITETHRIKQEQQKAEQLEAIGKVAGGIAHDFNNLLTAILGYSSFLLNDLESGKANHQRALQIHKAAEKASDLTRQLLAFSRKQVLNTQELNLNEIVQDLKAIFMPLLPTHIEIGLDLDPNLSPIRGDRSQIEQVIMNLVINARDAMLDGGMLQIATQDVWVRTSDLPDFDIAPGLYNRMSVLDTGSGMDPQMSAHIFEPFFTTKQKDKGTGLGLSTVYGIVKQHNGYVTVQTEPGKGTVFQIFLPAGVGDEAQLQSDTGLSRATILVVEDERSVRELASEALQTVGYKVLTACDVDEALDIMSMYSDPIDLIVCDIILPSSDGPTLYNKLQYFKSDLKILYISGYSAGFLYERSLLTGEEPFLQKPFVLEALIDVVGRLLKK